jgi:hypothetical protein
MLHNVLSEYLQDIASAVQQLEDVYVERYEEEILSPSRINLRIRIRFSSGELLEINEAAILKTYLIVYLGYRYHFQDKENHLIFRYDDTPHFPDLLTFPHHKHLPANVISTEKPSIFEVIEEAQSLVQ